MAVRNRELRYIKRGAKYLFSKREVVRWLQGDDDLRDGETGGAA